MAHPYAEKAKSGHSKKLEGYGGKSKKSDNWAGEKDLNTAGEPAGLMPIMKEPKLSQETNEKIMRKAGGKVAPTRMDKAPRKAKGGAMAKSAHPDEAEDKALIRKMVKKEDLKMKSGGRAERKDGGRIGKLAGGSMMGKKPGSTINLYMPGSGQPQINSGDMGGMPNMPPPGAMPPPGGMPLMPPAGMAGGMPPMGAPVGPIQVPPGPPIPPAAPIPPTGMPPGGGVMNNRPPMVRKRGGKVTSTEDLTAGSGSAEGRLQKTELTESDRKKG